MTSAHDPARLRQGLHPLTTASPGVYNSSLHSPISAVSMSSSHLQSAQTPGSSAIQPYNPQEWGPAQAAVAERPRQFAGETQGKPLLNSCLGPSRCSLTYISWAATSTALQSPQESTATPNEYCV
ncbi:hypothetical protein FZEAL_4453 [Fusarium zealandicum]|uniref:Uncharacterized protein n=1 Tax=Fusarium zealandicum TaxID=1053134 RepID=A0A8H4UM88_9HYPO|nr:hypothetical protein FZEAL_4453 [Fusarium zealandicum]